MTTQEPSGTRVDAAPVLREAEPRVAEQDPEHEIEESRRSGFRLGFAEGTITGILGLLIGLAGLYIAFEEYRSRTAERLLEATQAQAAALQAQSTQAVAASRSMAEFMEKIIDINTERLQQILEEIRDLRVQLSSDSPMSTADRSAAEARLNILSSEAQTLENEIRSLEESSNRNLATLGATPLPTTDLTAIAPRPISHSATPARATRAPRPPATEPRPTAEAPPGTTAAPLPTAEPDPTDSPAPANTSELPTPGPEKTDPSPEQTSDPRCGNGGPGDPCAPTPP